jgi:F-type H+-transporting ATPase subunit alpha
MRKISGRLRLDLAQYREMAAFAKFGSDLDKSTQDKLAQGERLMEVLKQPQLSPYPLERQIAILFLATNEYLMDIESRKVASFTKSFLAFLDENHAGLMQSVGKTGVLSADQEEELHTAVKKFKELKL